jgi:hypothetical protein
MVRARINIEALKGVETTDHSYSLVLSFVMGYGLDPMQNNKTWLDKNCRARDSRPGKGVYCEGWLG